MHHYRLFFFFFFFFFLRHIISYLLITPFYAIIYYADARDYASPRGVLVPRARLSDDTAR